MNPLVVDVPGVDPHDERRAGLLTFCGQHLLDRVVAPGFRLHTGSQCFQLFSGQTTLSAQQRPRAHGFGPDDEVGLLAHGHRRQPQVRQENVRLLPSAMISSPSSMQ